MKHVPLAIFSAMAFVGFVLGLSCGPAGFNGIDNGAGASLGDSCPASRTTSIPGAGTLRVTWTTDAQVTGEQSGLGRALGLAFLAGELADQSQSLETLIEVGADGSLSDSGGRFAIVDGCLAMMSDEVGGLNGVFNLPTAEELSEEFFAAPPEFLGNCAEGQIAIGPNGIGDTSGTHICLESDFDSCVSCDQTSTQWAQSARISMTFRAIGSLQDVATFGPTGGGSRVDIRDNDRVTFDLEVLVVYEPAP